MLSTRPEFEEYIYKTNVKGSNKASSYVRALDMLGEILSQSRGPFERVSSIWDERSQEKMGSLRAYILKQQKKADGIFQTNHPPSYWQKGHYSAALGFFRAFLIERDYENDLLSKYGDDEFDRADFDFEPEGKEVVEIILNGREKWAETKVRIDQSVFRRKILSIYNSECCITGLNVPALNVASHIIPWKERAETRLDPRNGLCLSATYDKAFDRHLIGIDKNYRVLVSPMLKEFYSRDVVKEYFDSIEGIEIKFPRKFIPEQKYLAVHRRRLEK